MSTSARAVSSGSRSVGDTTGLYVARDAASNRTDEAFDQTVPVNLLDPGIVARRISDRPQHRPILDEGLRTRPQRVDQNLSRLVPALT